MNITLTGPRPVGDMLLWKRPTQPPFNVYPTFHLLQLTMGSCTTRSTIWHQMVTHGHHTSYMFIGRYSWRPGCLCIYVFLSEVHPFTSPLFLLSSVSLLSHIQTHNYSSKAAILHVANFVDYPQFPELDLLFFPPLQH